MTSILKEKLKEYNKIDRAYFKDRRDSASKIGNGNICKRK